MARKWIRPRAQDCDASHCVEVSQGEDPNHIYLRSSDLPQFKTLVTRAEMAAFLASAKAGHYDHLVAGL